MVLNAQEHWLRCRNASDKHASDQECGILLEVMAVIAMMQCHGCLVPAFGFGLSPAEVHLIFSIRMVTSCDGATRLLPVNGYCLLATCCSLGMTTAADSANLQGQALSLSWALPMPAEEELP